MNVSYVSVGDSNVFQTASSSGVQFLRRMNPFESFHEMFIRGLSVSSHLKVIPTPLPNPVTYATGVLLRHRVNRKTSSPLRGKRLTRLMVYSLLTLWPDRPLSAVVFLPIFVSFLLVVCPSLSSPQRHRMNSSRIGTWHYHGPQRLAAKGFLL